MKLKVSHHDKLQPTLPWSEVNTLRLLLQFWPTLYEEQLSLSVFKLANNATIDIHSTKSLMVNFPEHSSLSVAPSYSS